MTGAPLLQISDLCVAFPTPIGPANAVHSVSINLEKGECLAVVGESGSGKSQTFLAAMGLSPKGALVSGDVRYWGKSVLSMSNAELRAFRGPQAAMIFQNPLASLTPHMTIATQMVEAYRAHTNESKEAALERAENALADVRIPNVKRIMKQYAFELSGGMAQRVMIAMAMLCEPDLIIADEATTALDVTVQAEILHLLMEQQKSKGVGLAFITHDMAVVAQIADRVAVMYAGRIVETGTVDDILTTPQHPYTKRLIEAAPRLSGPVRDTLNAIDGQPPRLTDEQKGCAFAPRCQDAFAPCSTDLPPLIEAGETQAAACHLLTREHV